MAFPKDFLIGAATAAHQVEGNNIHSDYWLQEQMPHTSFTEPSGLACDHYNRYEEDIRLLADAGLNAYRFSVEWARIEPEEGRFDEAEVEHYRRVIACCIMSMKRLEMAASCRPMLASLIVQMVFSSPPSRSVT